MITLATLEKATPQQVFDQVLFGLREQGRASVNPVTGKCAYRSDDGCKCAAGMLIGEDEYSRSILEGAGWNILVQIEQVPPHHIDLIGALQEIHDSDLRWRGIGAWEGRMEDLACRYRLTYTPPENAS